MSRASPEMRNFAAWIIEHERKSAEAETPPAFPVCEKLRSHLTTLMGSTGFHALLSRALAVAKAEDAGLRAVHVNADGTLAGFDDPQANPKEMAEGNVVLVAQLFGLLVAFIGEKLTLQMVREVWPELSPRDLDFGN